MEIITKEEKNYKTYILLYEKTSYIEFVIDKDLKSCTITNILVEINKRNKGIGTILLKKCFEICDKKVKYYELDDMSCRWNKCNNIYKKFGFTYLYIENGVAIGPEMIKNCN
jgi:hypothetical protein